MESPEVMLTKLDDLSLANWSDKKREDFCTVFDQRVRASRFILQTMVVKLLERTSASHMLGKKAHSELSRERNSLRDLCDRTGGHIDYQKIGGRSAEELTEIAESRVRDLMKVFPKMVDAVEVIDSTTAERMRKRDQLIEQCTKERDELQEVCEPISMTSVAEEHPTMTVRAFIDMVKARDAKRLELTSSIQKKMDEGLRLEGEIAKALYKGLPGLSEAVADAIRGYVKQDAALDVVNRRVAEKVRFGDSDAAREILSHFEKDEQSTDSDVAERLSQAVKQLGIPTKGRRSVKK